MDQEDNMREILYQMDLEMLQTVFQTYHANMPNEEELRNVRVISGGDMTLEEYMVEILIEENYLKRYEDIKISDVPIMPTEEDLWEKRVPNVVHMTQKSDLDNYLSVEDMKLR